MSRRSLSKECSLDTEQAMQEGMIGNGVPAEKIYLVNAGFSFTDEE
jgi:vancomycin permeability regulator SanA